MAGLDPGQDVFGRGLAMTRLDNGARSLQSG